MEEKKLDPLAQSIMNSLKNKVSAATLTQVINDWLSCFPELKRFKSGQKILRRSGPVVYGIELEKFLSDEYRPRVILYNLLANDTSLGAVIDQTIRTEKQLTVSVKYSHHSVDYLTASRLLKEQSRISLSDNLSIEDIVKGIYSYVKYDSLNNCFWSCRAIMQLSRLITVENKKEEYFEDGFDLLKQKVPIQWLEEQTRGISTWKNQIKNLSFEQISAQIDQNIKKYGFNNIPSI